MMQKEPEDCWICSVKLPSMKVREALKTDPTFLDGVSHFGSLSRFDNESYCCDECGEVEAIGWMMAPLSDHWRAWIRMTMDEAQEQKDRDKWRAAICMARGAMLGHHEASLATFEKMMEKFE